MRLFWSAASAVAIELFAMHELIVVSAKGAGWYKACAYVCYTLYTVILMAVQTRPLRVVPDGHKPSRQPLAFRAPKACLPCLVLLWLPVHILATRNEIYLSVELQRAATCLTGIAQADKSETTHDWQVMEISRRAHRATEGRCLCVACGGTPGVGSRCHILRCGIVHTTGRILALQLCPPLLLSTWSIIS